MSLQVAGSLRAPIEEPGTGLSNIFFLAQSQKQHFLTKPFPWDEES